MVILIKLTNVGKEENICNFKNIYSIIASYENNFYLKDAFLFRYKVPNSSPTFFSLISKTFRGGHLWRFKFSLFRAIWQVVVSYTLKRSVPF